MCTQSSRSSVNFDEEIERKARADAYIESLKRWAISDGRPVVEKTKLWKLQDHMVRRGTKKIKDLSEDDSEEV